MYHGAVVGSIKAKARLMLVHDKEGARCRPVLYSTLLCRTVLYTQKLSSHGWKRE